MKPAKPNMDERTSIPLDPEEAIRALLKVDPESEPAEDEESVKGRVETGQEPVAEVKGGADA